jgi:hypothetical protein
MIDDNASRLGEDSSSSHASGILDFFIEVGCLNRDFFPHTLGRPCRLGKETEEEDTMQRRTLIKTAAAVPLVAGPLGGGTAGGCGDAVVWKPIDPAPADIPALDGHSDTVPDIVGRLGVPIGLAIFTEGNHFPALLGGEVIEPFRNWARTQRAMPRWRSTTSSS